MLAGLHAVSVSQPPTKYLQILLHVTYTAMPASRLPHAHVTLDLRMLCSCSNVLDDK